ncbi:MAG: hypothetical protein DRI46_08400 [Chloroflexi bacterium]|nr:MAG: hypothetical protein DRI46_08400 [Chloroflexota bacterium]
MADLFTSVQYEIGDSDPEHGIMPGNKQVTASQFQYAAAQERVTEMLVPTQREIGRVSAKLLEMAQAAWATQPVESELGPSAEVNKTSSFLGQKAKELRLSWGHGGLESDTAGRDQRVSIYSGHGAYIVPPGIN